MNAKRIMRELTKPYYPFPEKPLRAATAPQYREEMTEALLDVLTHTKNNLDAVVNDPDYLLHHYAMFRVPSFVQC